MDFEHAPCVEELTGRLRALMGSGVEPAEAERRRVVAEGRHPEALVDGLEEKAKAEGLWNLFLPDLEEDEPGTRLSDRESAPMAEIMGRIPWSSEVFDRHAPDTGDIESLHLFATDEQRGRRLGPLLAGTIRSGVSITEPDEASSDPTNLATGIERDGDDHVADGRKWFTTGAPHPKFAFTLVMGVSDSDPDSAAARPPQLRHRAHRHARLARRADHAPPRARGAPRGGVRERARAGGEPPRGGGGGVRGRAGAARARTHPPLQAHDRPARARDRSDVRPRPGAQRLRPHARRARRRPGPDRRERDRRSTRRDCRPPPRAG